MPYRNYMEDAITEELNGVMKKLKGSCDCERCKEDIVAYTLNRMPAKYVVTPLGNAYTKLSQLKAQTMADITVRLMEAARIVKKNPRH